jgi:hypothetical protein
VLLLPDAAAGQTVRGAVIDSVSRTPVPGVQVQVMTPAEIVVATTASSGTGWFQLSGLRPGRYYVRATHPTWGGDGLLEVVLAPAETLTVIVELAGTAIPLDSIVVAVQAWDRLSGFRERAAGRGQGHYIHRADIDKRPYAPLSAHLAFVPGIRFERVNDSSGLITTMLLMRSLGELCLPAIYLDGLPVPHYPGMDIDDLISSENVEGIEIYGSYVTAPLELHLPQHTCGVIALWSRAAARRLTLRQMLGLGAVFGVMTILSSLLF